MRNLLLIPAIALACTVAMSRVSAQSAMFTYTGVPVGPVVPGSSFTIGINVVVTTGGSLNNMWGLSYWFFQFSPAGPFPFAITNRDLTGSMFNMGGNLVYPQTVDPINRPPTGILSDLGATLPIGMPGLPSGTYFIANLSFSVASNSVPGIYNLGNTTSSTPGIGGRISVWADDKGDTAPMAASPFNITVVPEPGSVALLCVGLVLAGALAYRRRVPKPAETNL